MSVVLKPVIRKTGRHLDPALMQAQAQAQLRKDALALVNRMAHYPPQAPTTYVRTGNLGRNWLPEVKGPAEIWIVNRARSSVSLVRTKTKGVRPRVHKSRPYAAVVQGPIQTQAKIMAAKGWRRIDVEAAKIFKAQKGIYYKIFTGRGI